MAELYFRNWEDETAASFPKGAHRKGDVLFTRPDGHSDNPNWQFSQEANTDKLLMVKCPELALPSGDSYAAPWEDDFGWDVLQSNAGQGTYDIRAYEKTPGAAGQHNLTAEKIEAFLGNWSCSDISFGNNYCDFTFRLWGAVRSVGFWESTLFVANVDFELLSYSGSTGIGDIEITCTDNPAADPSRIAPFVARRGGELYYIQHPVYRFRMERSTLFEAFKDDCKRKIQTIYRRHRYYVTQGVLDWIMAQGNGPTVTLEQLQTYLQDKAS